MINGTLSMNKKATGQIIKFPSVIPMLLKFLPLCSPSLQLEILTKFTLLVSRSVHNMELCRRERVVPSLIGFLESTTDDKLLVRETGENSSQDRRGVCYSFKRLHSTILGPRS